MLDVPVISSVELCAKLAEDNIFISKEEIATVITSLSEIKGWGGLVKEEYEGEDIYFLTQAQLLMMSCKLDVAARWRIVSTVMSLSDHDDVVKEVSTAAINRRIHLYHENINLIETYRPLTNLLCCCYDNEYFAATHYQFTHVFNKMTSSNLTSYELKNLMVKHKYLTTTHRTIVGGVLKETEHYIEGPDGSFVKVYSPIYTEENISLLAATMRT